MLSPADAALAARDPDLPGLAALLDARGMAAQVGLADMQPTYLRYKPGTSCVVALTSPTGSLRAWAAMAYPPGRYAEVREREEWRTGPLRAHFVDEHCIAVTPLGLDREIAAARVLQYSDGRRAFLAHFGLEDTTLRLLRYKPGRRLVLRADGAEGPRALIKAHADEAFRAAFAGARHAARVAGVPLLGIRKRRRSVVSGWIEGSPMAGASGTAAHRLTGAELARLHGAAPRPGEPVALPDAQTAAGTVAALLPDEAEKAAALAARLDTALRAIAATPCRIHGDFTADQVLLRDGAPVVIDWDRMGVGAPAQDLGTFLARLDADVIEGILAASEAEAAATALCDGYAATAGAVPEGVEEHRAAALLAIAGEGFRTRRPAWDAEARAVLALISDRLDGRRAAAREPTPGLSGALDPARMGPTLGATPAVTLLRHKPGRRALIRYDLPGRPPMLGKLRAKGPDRRTPRLHQALRAAGLDGRGPHHVGVPEPLGQIGALWLQEVVSGRPLGDILTTDALRSAGKALGILHAADAAADRSWTMDDELAVLRAAFAALPEPSLRARAERLLGIAERLLGALPPAAATGIHRDFHPDQVLIDGRTAWLVDLDLFARGDPLLDLGNLRAHLTELSLRLHGRADGFRAGADAFLTGYEEFRGPVDRDRLAVLEWVSFIRHVAISQRMPDRSHATAAILSTGEACARGLEDA
ncbi:phosphotransferase [Histidinibacterium lentulum]|nr:phosphotransferase [Histidinibacterium lentulum]